MRGFKAQTWEGGIRIPFIVQWKGHLPAGKVDDRPVIQLDILPTADDSYDLGSSSYRWRDLYLGPTTLHIYSTAAETTTARDWKLSIQETDGVTEGDLRILRFGGRERVFGLVDDGHHHHRSGRLGQRRQGLCLAGGAGLPGHVRARAGDGAAAGARRHLGRRAGRAAATSVHRS